MSSNVTGAVGAVAMAKMLAGRNDGYTIGLYVSSMNALVSALPETGRRHQIRRHLKHIAHPIIGDATHGKGAHNRWWAQHLGLQRLWLHATELRLRHPVDGREMVLRSDPRDATLNPDWHALLARPWVWADEGGDRSLCEV